MTTTKEIIEKKILRFFDLSERVSMLSKLLKLEKIAIDFISNTHDPRTDPQIE